MYVCVYASYICDSSDVIRLHGIHHVKNGVKKYVKFYTTCTGVQLHHLRQKLLIIAK
jgi:hypothetical protein